MTWRVAASIAALATLFAAGRPAAMAPSDAAAISVDHGVEDPAVSPDGRRIAVSVLGKIFTMAASGGDAAMVDDGIGWDTHPAWSPDGQFLAYAHQLPHGADLVVHNFVTGDSTSVYHTDQRLGQIAYHPSGGDIFFLLDRNQYDSHLWRVPTGGGDAKQVTFTDNWHEWSFALSPDGSEVIVDSGHYGASDLYRIHLDGLKPVRLTRTPAHESSVAWTRDGSAIGFVATRNGVDHVMIRPAASGDARSIFSSPYDQKQLAFMPDGKTAIVAAGRRLLRVDVASGASSPIQFTARFARPARLQPDIVIAHARLFDGRKDEYTSNAVIEIRGGRIAAVSTGEPHPGPGALVIDAAGKTVLPGLMDNHYHYWSAFDGAGLISRGITSVRDPGSAISSNLNFKDAIALGLIAGPTIHPCGPLIDGSSTYHPMVAVELENADGAAPLVRALKAQGVEALKVYFMLPPDILRAVIREARAQRLPVTGHIGVRTSWTEAIEAGINGFNHIRVWRDFLALDRQPQGENESLDTGRNPVGRMQADWSDIDPSGVPVERLIRAMADRHVALDPTLALQRIGDGARRRFSLEEFATAQDSYRRMGAFVLQAQKAGVMLLAGTDNGNLFDEVESYADAGVPHAAILKAVTSNGAAWLGQSDQYGTVEPGKTADVVIVDGDPMKEIKDLRKIDVVIKDGRIAFRR